MIDTWGLMPDRATARVIGHEFYVHIEPDDGGKNPPPWWVLGIVARILPSLRRKLKIAQHAVDSGLLESLPKRWRSELKPQLERELRAYVDLDLTTMTDRQLFEHLDDLLAFSARNMTCTSNCICRTRLASTSSRPRARSSLAGRRRGHWSFFRDFPSASSACHRASSRRSRRWRGPSSREGDHRKPAD